MSAHPLPSAIGHRPSSRRRPARSLKFPGLSVTLPYQRYLDHGRAYWTLFYYRAGLRIRENRATFARLKARAEQVATDIANGHAAMSAFTEADRARWLAVCENFARTGVAPETGSAQYADLHAQLGGASLADAVKFFLESRPRASAPRPVPILVDMFLAQKQGEISRAWLDHLSHRLRRLAAWYTGPLHALRSADINAWLRALKSDSGIPLGPRARHNHRAALDQLARWARSEGHLPPTWSELDHVPDPGQRPGEVKILSPEQMTSLLAARQQAEQCGRAHSSLVPLLVVQAFAGVRHAEALKLDWRDVHLDERFLYISKGIAKTGRDRVIPVLENLAAWLAPHARRNGPLCDLAQSSGALTKAKRQAGIPSARNQTHNTLRKSFISYRLAVTRSIAQVAEEAGNSPAVIRKHYSRPLPEAEGKRWFAVHPAAADILQLNFQGL